MSLEDVKNKKIITLPEESKEISETPIRNLSLKLSEVLPSIHHADLIEEKSLLLLNNPASISEFPSAEPVDEKVKKFMVAGKASEFYTVKVTLKNKVSCDCKGFRFAKICSHSVAIAEKENLLPGLIKGVKISFRSSITYPVLLGEQEEKGAGKERIEYTYSLLKRWIP